MFLIEYKGDKIAHTWTVNLLCRNRIDRLDMFYDNIYFMELDYTEPVMIERYLQLIL